MKKLKMKKGFTLVELIVVIAIVAILAAVSVVSYLAFIGQANESADIQLVKQLNVALEADEALNGPRDTMHEMLGAMEDNGFVVENLTKTKSGYDIVWDQEHNRFGLLNGEDLVYGESTYNSAKAWNIWKFADTENEAKNKSYSVYLTEEFANTDVDSLDVKAGLDTGSYDKLTSISYENTSNNEQEVVIRTNGGTLTVNAPLDTVKHYDYAESVNIEKIASTSYREYGKVGYANIANGRLVIEEAAEIDGIYLVANASGEFDGIKLAVVGNATLPAIARADVPLDDGESKLVVEIQTLATSDATDENPEYIWITGAGSGTTVAISSSSTDATATVTNPSTVAVAAKNETKESAAPVSDNSVARINAVGYSSLKEAFEAAKNGDVITVLSDTDIAEIIVVENQLVLDLNGKTITNEVTGSQSYSYTDEDNTTTSAPGRAFVLTDESALTVNANGGKMVIPSTNKNSYGFFRIYTATLTLNGGEYSGDTVNGTFFHAYADYGAEINLNNVVATTNYRFVASNNYVWGTVSVNGGTFVQDNTDLATSNGTIPAFYLAGFETTIEDATITSSIGSCVEIAGYDPYTKATFKGNNNFTVLHSNNIQSWNATAIAVHSHGKAIIESGTYTGDYGLYIFTSGGDVTINGGRFVGTKQAAVMSSFDSNSYGYDGWYAKVTINNGSFVGNVKTNGNSLASIEINGGDFTDATVAQIGVTDNRQ